MGKCGDFEVEEGVSCSSLKSLTRHYCHKRRQWSPNS